MSDFDAIATIRPSALPALAKCPKYRGRETAGAAAARGARLDSEIRAVLAGGAINPEGLDALDMKAIERGVGYIREAAAGTRILSSEEDTRITFPIPGTSDGILPAKNHTLDVKTGRQRNYEPQMAAYAAGAMDRYFEDTWRTTIVYVDLELVEWRNWTMDEALSVLREIAAGAKDPFAAPQPCDYCSWCAHAATCPPRREAIESAFPPLAGVLEEWDAILADPIRLGAVLQACQPLRDFVEDQLPEARSAAMKHIVEGRGVPGTRMISVKPTQQVSPLKQGHFMPTLGFDAILSMHGPVSLKKFSEMWAAKRPGVPLPDNVSDMEKSGYSYLRIDKPKANT